jgi:DNA-directed RNA polymerase subunit N (RpoN/RPB10)
MCTAGLVDNNLWARRAQNSVLLLSAPTFHCRLALPAFTMPSIDDSPNRHPTHTGELMDRIRSYLTALRTVDNAQMIEATIELAREAHALTAENNFYKINACLLLAESLRLQFGRDADDRLLEEMISLGRETLALAPERHAIRADLYGDLAASLKMHYEHTGHVGALDEAIDLQREAYDLYPAGHLDRFLSCGNLSISLGARYQHTADMEFLDEAINLEREALDLCPQGHPDRFMSCANLASCLKTRYQRTDDISVLDEAIGLEHQAIDLWPAGYPGRFMSCGKLATSLWTMYELKGDFGLLDKVINLEREALSLVPAGHSIRPTACGNLATSLWRYYEHNSDISVIDEVIDLGREALDLCPLGHPGRSTFSGNLATSLNIRYSRTGDVGLQDEAIDLQRQALNLCPSGHPHHFISCANLASSLSKRYKRTGDMVYLEEAIDLQRETLGFCPIGHPVRYGSCGGLARSLWTRYKRTGDVVLLDEAIDLQREALDLCPAGHSGRYSSCGNLSRSLWTRYKRTTDVALLHESLTLLQEATTTAPVHLIWRELHDLTQMHLQNTSPIYDINKAILYLSQSLEDDSHDPLAFVISVLSLLDNLWECSLEGKHIQLTPIYQRLVNLLPLLVHPALGLQPQLHALKACARLGSDAFVNAVLADDCSVGLETLELAQGVIWSQTLHRRDPQLTNVPEHLASKLQSLTQSFAFGSTTELDETRKWLTPRDMLHTRSSRAYAVIHQIRSLPGLDRFMLGESFDILRTVATSYPIVVLVSARGHHYALVMAPSIADHAVLSLNLTAEDLTALFFTKDSLRQSRGGMVVEPSADRALKISTPSRAKALEQQFEVLWEKVVKPVLKHLDLKVSDRDDINL